MSTGWLVLSAGFLLGALAFWMLAGILTDRHQIREAAPTLPVDLPYMAPGSWHKASGPVPAFDLPAPANSASRNGGAVRGGEHHPEWVLRMLTGDLAAAVAADLQHCAHLAGMAS